MKTGCYTHSCSTISVLLCELVTDCGSAVVQRSSWDRHDFGGSLPVAWSHPTLACIKLVISTVFIIYPSYLQSLRSDHPWVCPYHFPMNVNMINFMEKRVLVRTSQADPTREKMWMCQKNPDWRWSNHGSLSWEDGKWINASSWGLGYNLCRTCYWKNMHGITCSRGWGHQMAEVPRTWYAVRKEGARHGDQRSRLAGLGVIDGKGSWHYMV
jgi:hypothetical protein